MLRHRLQGSTKMSRKKKRLRVCGNFFPPLSGNLGPIFKVPCSKNFLVWYYCFVCTNQIQALIWATGDYFVLPWRLIFKYWVLYHKLLNSRSMQRALHFHMSIWDTCWSPIPYPFWNRHIFIEYIFLLFHFRFKLGRVPRIRSADRVFLRPLTK